MQLLAGYFICQKQRGDTEMRKRALVIMGLLLIAISTSAAQDLAKMQRMPAAVFDIPFAFYADKTLLPAGSYEFRPNFTESGIEVRNVKGDIINLVSALTSLSPRNLKGNRAQIAFDVVGDQHYLSELYMPGLDGMAFNGSSDKHKHQMIVSVK
jgi:hypothetical protein